MELLVASGEAEVVGADESSTLKHRRGAMIRLVVSKKTYRLKKSDTGAETTLVTAEAPRTIIERSIGTPSLYANIAVEKFDRAMPLFRQEERFALAGAPVDRSVMSRWLEQLGATLGATVLRVTRDEAFRTAMCLSTDATGILIQQGRDPATKARRPCKKGHYFVQIADRDAVFFEYTEKETSAVVLSMFRGFSGYVQADANDRRDLQTIGQLTVRSKAGDMVPLSAFAQLVPTVGPAVASQYNLYPTAAILGASAAGVSSGESRS